MGERHSRSNPVGGVSPRGETAGLSAERVRASARCPAALSPREPLPHAAPDCRCGVGYVDHAGVAADLRGRAAQCHHRAGRCVGGRCLFTTRRALFRPAVLPSGVAHAIGPTPRHGCIGKPGCVWRHGGIGRAAAARLFRGLFRYCGDADCAASGGPAGRNPVQAAGAQSL